MNKNLTVKIKVENQYVSLFLEMAKIMIENTRREKGNVSYTLYNEYNDQSSFIFIEEFVDSEAFEIHVNTDYYKEFIRKLTPILKEDPIVKWYS
ncbi:antibiotic biosynthesis monooxygenase [Flavobacterium columnare NBRC 100251 = ATCC 23463]|uniref:ABM domain-containing protein n=2 Tax=Flavobacterium columnare TaxID=996 RepID=G8XAD9_FLACA|nr:putative quinol monooxygenase [Flavobacterium columnare]AEW85997.1 hypothetical protein FCOL_05860 [Flavobacterium columnare ATCC 49512]AMO19774.1 antibiotic biosynthesis monooxygenase [Flavobacterium columnare]ANO48763.1 hypothetical protein Pf1_00515 [Flavobacterium columnare]APT23207.1 antibiotic biosynthesis monooxygenase [Flavobacterium columnare]AUX17705.1 hypothetical protein AQ623_05000 [Flavobacterium columnare]